MQENNPLLYLDDSKAAEYLNRMTPQSPAAFVEARGFFASGASINAELNVIANAIGINHAIAANNTERAIVKRDSRGEITPRTSFNAIFFNAFIKPLAENPSVLGSFGTNNYLDCLIIDIGSSITSKTNFRK